MYDTVMETQSREETERIIRMLRTALRLLGFTNREIERRLGYTPSYLTRLFSGQIELRFEHIVDIVNAMGMTAEEFFQFAYPARQGERSEQAMQLNEVLEELRPAPPRAPYDWNEEKLQQLFRHNMDIAYSRLRDQIQRESEEQDERDRERRRQRRAAKKSAAAASETSSEGSGKSRPA